MRWTGLVWIGCVALICAMAHAAENETATLSIDFAAEDGIVQPCTGFLGGFARWHAG